MSHLVQPRLVNGPFDDPALYVDFRFGRRALLFDLGDVSALSPREILRVGQVFVSHMHMDHFAGFDRLLRLFLYQDRTLRLVGPPGLCAAVAGKLSAYTWNLLGPDSAGFAIVAEEWTPQGFVGAARFAARAAFAREAAAPPPLAPGLLAEDAEFVVEGAALDHGVPSLAFALQERRRVNVHKPRLDALGLPVGAWLTEAKRALRGGAAPDTPVALPGGHAVTLGRLVEAGVLVHGPGQRVVYATDLAGHARNRDRLVALARGADRLYIEAPFLAADAALAAARRHLTAAEAGAVARAAGVATAVPFHFSSRYAGREEALRAEFARHWQAAASPGR